MTHLVQLRGCLDLTQLDAAFEGLEGRCTSTGQIALLYDCTAMTGYTPEARTRFVEWHRRHRGEIGRVGIVTSNVMWHMVISAMSLASGRAMVAFSSLDEAREWAGEFVGATTRHAPIRAASMPDR